MRLLGVHGIGNHRTGEDPATAAAHLSGIWSKALQLDRPITMEVVYYAHLLRDGSQGEATTLDDLDPLATELALAWIREFAPPEGVDAGYGTALLRQYLGWLVQFKGLGGPLAEWFVTRFFDEVATYLATQDAPKRLAVREWVGDAIERVRPDVVVAHSLGTVVTFEALWQRPDVHVPLLVTLGSPLALPRAVRDRLLPPRERPPAVQRWVNLADPGDLVAIPEGGVSKDFTGVDMDRHTLAGAFDFHRATGYLRARKVTAVLQRHADTANGQPDGPR